MRRRRAAIAGVALAAAVLAVGARACGEFVRERRRQHVANLERERELLLVRLSTLIANDERFESMPNNAVRFGVPSSVSRALIQQVTASFVDQVTLVLERIEADAHGDVRKVITLGEYQLHLRIPRLSGQLRTGQPEVAFAKNGITLTVPITVTRGMGHATIDFSWNSKHAANFVCGDMEIRGLEVDGTIEPDNYLIRGSFELTRGARRPSLVPRFPTTKIKLRIAPSPASWAKVEAILNERRGVCGWVLDRIDVPSLLRDLLERGVSVRLPTEKLQPLDLPTGIEQSMTIGAKPIKFKARMDSVAITKRMIWVGADVRVIVFAPGVSTP